MAEVSLHIGGNNYTISCRDGEEQHLIDIAAIVDQKAVEARDAVGGVSEVRQLLLASLLLADELQEAQANGAAPSQSAPPADDKGLALVENIAERLETLATKLEMLSHSA
jgi:cell division protein ZapA